MGSACTPRISRSTPAPGVCGKAPAHRGSLVVLQSAGSPRATGEGAPAGSHHTQALRPLPPGHAQQRPGPQVTGSSLSTSRSNRSTCREPQVLQPRCTSQATRPLPSLSLLAPLSPLCTPTPPAEKFPRPSGLLWTGRRKKPASCCWRSCSSTCRYVCPGLDKPPAAHTMALACQHYPISPRQTAPKPLTDRGWEPQPTWASLHSFLWLFRGTKPSRREAVSVQRR